MRLPRSREHGKIPLDGAMLVELAKAVFSVERALYFSTDPNAPPPSESAFWNSISDTMAAEFPTTRPGDDWRAITGRLPNKDLQRLAKLISRLEAENPILVIRRSNGSSTSAGYENMGGNFARFFCAEMNRSPASEGEDAGSSGSIARDFVTEMNAISGEMQAQPDLSNSFNEGDAESIQSGMKASARCGNCWACVLL